MGNPKPEAWKQMMSTLMKEKYRKDPLAWPIGPGEKTPEHLANIAQALARPEVKAKITRIRKDAALKQWAALSTEERRRITAPGALASRLANPSGLERAMYAELDALQVEYIPQHPIMRYIVDIFIPSKWAVVECDGTYWHSRPGAEERDHQRDLFLYSQGYTVLRLSEEEITTNPKAAALKVVEEVGYVTP